MKKLNQIILLMALAMVTTMFSCGKDDAADAEPTEKELVVAALTGTWTIDATASSFANTGLDGSDVGVTFTETGFSLTGGIATYISGGTYVISDAGAITSAAVTVASTEIAIDGTPSVSLNADKTQITLSFSTVEAAGRVSGLGAYKVVFTKN